MYQRSDDMKKIKTPILKDESLLFIDSKEHKAFYLQLIEGIFFSMYEDEILNQIQYELCKKELYNIKYNL